MRNQMGLDLEQAATGGVLRGRGKAQGEGSGPAADGRGVGGVGQAQPRTILTLGYPVSANRYWRTCRGRTFRSAEADRYKDSAKRAASLAGLPQFDGPVAVYIALHPKLTKKGVASLARMDLDNCIKVTLDALNGVAYCDDAQVVRLFAEIGHAIRDGGLSVVVRSVEGRA